jgi:hypothetical protein
MLLYVFCVETRSNTLTCAEVYIFVQYEVYAADYAKWQQINNILIWKVLDTSIVKDFLKIKDENKNNYVVSTERRLM